MLKVQPTLNNVSAINKMRETISRLEKHLNELTNGEFFGFCAHRGLETYSVKELEGLLLKHYSSELMDTLRACIKEHKKFYEEYFELPLDSPSLKNDESVQNILKMWRKWGKRFSLTNYTQGKR